MAEQLKYVSPEYQARLDDLAGTLMKRFGGVAVGSEPTVLFESEMGSTVDHRTIR